MSVGVSSILNEKKVRFCICIFNRATYSRCKALIQEISAHPGMELTVVVSGSLLLDEYEKPVTYIERENKNVRIERIEVQYFKNTEVGSALTCSQITSKLAEYFDRERFDAVIVVADRFETLGAAIAAAYLNIPLIHIQGGEITGNIDEKVRHAVSKMSDYHFVATRLAKRYLIQMGEEPYRVYQTGCPSIDVLKRNGIRRHSGKKNYIICQFNPDTNNITEMYNQTKILLEAVVDYCGKHAQKCYWYWPNPDAGREQMLDLLDQAHKEYPEYLIKAKNQPPEEFLQFLASSKFLIGNSSCAFRECSYLGVPAINLGDRQSIRERSWNVVDCDFNKDEIFEAMETQHTVPKYKTSKLYGDGDGSKYICMHLSRIEKFTKKGPLTYPYDIRNRYDHFEEARFEHHREKRRHNKKPHFKEYEEEVRKRLPMEP